MEPHGARRFLTAVRLASQTQRRDPGAHKEVEYDFPQRPLSRDGISGVRVPHSGRYRDANFVAGMGGLHLSAQLPVHACHSWRTPSLSLYLSITRESAEIRSARETGEKPQVFFSKSGLGQHVLVTGQRDDDLVNL